jgi:hypothetical protein
VISLSELNLRTRCPTSPNRVRGGDGIRVGALHIGRNHQFDSSPAENQDGTFADTQDVLVNHQSANSSPNSPSTNAERGTTIVAVTHDPEVGQRLGRAVTIRDGRVGAEGRDGREFAVVAGDGTLQLPPDVLEMLPPGTLLSVEHANGKVTLLSDDHRATEDEN